MNRAALYLIFCASAAIAACAGPSDLQKAAGAFSTATSVTADVSLGYMNNLNKIERDGYLARLRWNPSQVISAQVLSTQTFADKDLAVRYAAIGTLRAYAKVVSELTSTESAQLVADNAKQLGAQLQDTSNKIRGLSAQTRETKLMAEFFGQLAKLLIEHKQMTTLRELVSGSADRIDKIAAHLAIDVGGAAERELARFSGVRADAVRFYNDNRTAMSDEQRRKALEEIRANEERLDALQARLHEITKLFDEFRQSHSSLNKALANGSSVALAIERTERFLQRAMDLAKPIEALAAR